MSAQAISLGFAGGAAALALWLVCRYPALGPGTLKAGLLLVVCAWGLLLVVSPATAAAAHTAGRPAALIFVSLPMLGFVFWAAAHLVRLYVAFAGRHRA